jgi:hypothetical protein
MSSPAYRPADLTDTRRTDRRGFGHDEPGQPRDAPHGHAQDRPSSLRRLASRACAAVSLVAPVEVHAKPGVWPGLPRVSPRLRAGTRRTGRRAFRHVEPSQPLDGPHGHAQGHRVKLSAMSPRPTARRASRTRAGPTPSLPACRPRPIAQRASRTRAGPPVEASAMSPRLAARRASRTRVGAAVKASAMSSPPAARRASRTRAGPAVEPSGMSPRPTARRASRTRARPSSLPACHPGQPLDRPHGHAQGRRAFRHVAPANRSTGLTDTRKAVAARLPSPLGDARFSGAYKYNFPHSQVMCK